jgi:hypothetical protein
LVSEAAFRLVSEAAFAVCVGLGSRISVGL